MTTATDSTALLEEVEAINSIYGPDTLVLDVSALTAILTLPSHAFTFRLSFSSAYPQSPPTVAGLASTGDHGKPGDGEAALQILRDVVGRAFIPGQVCLFDVIEDAAEALHSVSSHSEHEAVARSDLDTKPDKPADGSTLTPNTATHHPHHPVSPTPATTDITQWSLSTPITFKKSTFLAHAAHVTSPAQAHSYITHLKLSDKKIAAATHNISAYRIRSPSPKVSTADQVGIMQDCDDDGESAAGGRLLRLLQLMDVSDVVVVVSRWFGGVLLGGDRFRIINQVAREAVLGVTEDGKERGDGKTNGREKRTKGK